VPRARLGPCFLGSCLVPPIVPDPFRILYVRERLSGLVDKGRGTLRLLYVYIYLFDDPICQVGETGLVGLRMWI
jgi:hypothetical protein